MQNLLIAPHNDDETLFASFALQTLDPLVLIVYDSIKQYQDGDLACMAAVRRLETLAAVQTLRPDDSPWRQHQDCGVVFLGLDDRKTYNWEVVMSAIVNALRGAQSDSLLHQFMINSELWARAGKRLRIGCFDQVVFPLRHEGGNLQHNLVADVCAGIDWATEAGGRSGLSMYASYVNADGFPPGKIIAGVPAYERFPGRTGEMISRKLRALACYPSQLWRADCSPHFLRSQEEFYV